MYVPESCRRRFRWWLEEGRGPSFFFFMFRTCSASSLAIRFFTKSRRGGALCRLLLYSFLLRASEAYSPALVAKKRNMVQCFQYLLLGTFNMQWKQHVVLALCWNNTNEGCTRLGLMIHSFGHFTHLHFNSSGSAFWLSYPSRGFVQEMRHLSLSLLYW